MPSQRHTSSQTALNWKSLHSADLKVQIWLQYGVQTHGKIKKGQKLASCQTLWQPSYQALIVKWHFYIIACKLSRQPMSLTTLVRLTALFLHHPPQYSNSYSDFFCTLQYYTVLYFYCIYYILLIFCSDDVFRVYDLCLNVMLREEVESNHSIVFVTHGYKLNDTNAAPMDCPVVHSLTNSLYSVCYTEHLLGDKGRELVIHFGHQGDVTLLHNYSIKRMKKFTVEFKQHIQDSLCGGLSSA